MMLAPELDRWSHTNWPGKTHLTKMEDNKKSRHLPARIQSPLMIEPTP